MRNALWLDSLTITEEPRRSYDGKMRWGCVPANVLVHQRGMSEVTVTVSGPVGCGKSAIAGEIEIALKAIGVPVRYADEAAALSEKGMTHADWTSYLDMYKPSVVIVEQCTK